METSSTYGESLNDDRMREQKRIMGVSCGCGHRERLVKEYKATGELIVELGSDQTSLHNPFGGGYYPVQLSFSESQKMLKEDPVKFKELVEKR